MSLRNNRIILVGMPGSGKTTLGKQLADKTGRRFIDLDAEIVKTQNKSIVEIFSTGGEEYFRKMEREQLQAVLKNRAFVLATGGGTPCFFDNMEMIKKYGTSIFLDVPVEELILRMSNTAEHEKRPKLSADTALSETIKTLLKRRLPFYKQAHFILDSSATMDEILLMIKGY